MKAKDVLWSWDFILALVLTIATWLMLPHWVRNEFAHDLYGIGISVLSIVFAVFFAALAIIISSSDDDFVRYLEKDGDYTKIVATFQFSLATLFLALIYSLIMYAFTSAWLSQKFQSQPYWWLVIFGFLFSYGLFAALNSTFDSIQYAKYRVRYLIAPEKDAHRKQ